MPEPRSGLPALLTAVFAGATVDTIFRLAAAAALAAAAVAASGDPTVQDRLTTHYSSLTLLVFSLPFIALAPLAGTLGDRLPKHQLIRAVRLLDLPILVLGCVGLWMHNTWMLLAAVGLLGVASAFFAPVKLSVVPELVEGPRLPMANGWMQGITIAAILLGTGLASLSDPQLTGQHATLIIAVLGLGIAATGLIGSWYIPRLPARNPGAAIRPFDFIGQLRIIYAHPGLAVPVWSLAGFWALGAAATVLIVPIASIGWGVGALGMAAFSLCLALGIITGAGLAPLMMARKFPAGLPLMGALVAGGSLAASGWVGIGLVEHPQPWHPGMPLAPGMIPIGILFYIAGLGSGWWDVSMNVLLQERSPIESRTRVMAASSIITSIGTLAASFLCNVACEIPGVTSGRILFVLGGLSVGLALAGIWLYRNQVACWFGERFLRLCWRVEVHGAEHLPVSGGCVVAANHQSFGDGPLLASVLPRRTRFLIDRRFCRMPVVGWLLEGWGVVPIDARDHGRALVESVEAATEAARRGDVVGIFPEGRMTRSGQLNVFKPGIERIAGEAGVPIVPVAIDGLWRSPWSYNQTRGWLRPRRLVRVRLGAPLPPGTPAAVVRARVAELMFELSQESRARDQRTLGTTFLVQSRLMPLRPAVFDAWGQMPAWQIGGLAQALRTRLGLAQDEHRVGLLLPPGRGGVIANVSMALDGRTTVNLNHTAGTKQLARMCELAGIRTVVTAKAYLKRIGDPGLAGIRLVYLEDVLPAVPKLEILRHAILNWILPTRWRSRGRAGEVATIVFSSGSTGDPKGIQLTHRQVLADCDAIHDALGVSHRDVLLSPLPLFHSFGLVPGMWLGLVTGLRIAAHPDPTDAKTLGELAQKSGVTFTITTATFVRGWMRRIPAEQFKTMRFAVAGAERCPAELRAAFKERYGADLLEGYGCTELAPVVSTNLPDIEHQGQCEARTRDGCVGRPLPGMNAFTIHPETRERLAPGAEGLIIIQSPARMLGYLDRPDLDAKAFIHGGYDTGDIGRVEVDGFIRITGRLARFAKIGGEMVPLDLVEAAMQAAAGERAEVAVAAVPDPERGERLVCMYAGETPPNPEELLVALSDKAALWRPKGKDFHRVESIPRLGTGKRDLAALKKLAASLVQPNAQ